MTIALRLLLALVALFSILAAPSPAQNRNARLPVYVSNIGEDEVIVGLGNLYGSFYRSVAVSPGKSQFFVNEKGKRVLFPSTIRVWVNGRDTGSTLNELGVLQKARAGFSYWKITVGKGGIDP